MISATSDNPPTENRKNLRFKARAIERPMLVLPTPGGPERHIIFPMMQQKNINYDVLTSINRNMEQTITTLKGASSKLMQRSVSENKGNRFFFVKK